MPPFTCITFLLFVISDMSFLYSSSQRLLFSLPSLTRTTTSSIPTRSLLGKPPSLSSITPYPHKSFHSSTIRMASNPSPQLREIFLASLKLRRRLSIPTQPVKGEFPRPPRTVPFMTCPLLLLCQQCYMLTEIDRWPNCSGSISCRRAHQLSNSPRHH